MRLKKSGSRQVEQLKAQNAKLTATIERLTEDAEAMRRSRFSIPKAPTKRPKGSFVRLIVPDTHGVFADRRAIAAMLADARRFDIREVVLLGDHVDCGGFLAQHHTLGYLADATYTYSDDINAANVFLDELQDAAPKAAIWYIEGNHERRAERWAIDAAQQCEADANLLLRATAPRFLLHLEERQIRYVHTLEDDMSQGDTRNVLELGKCLFLHGYSHAKHATEKTLGDLGKNCVMGHIHRRQSFSRTTHDSEITAWCPGCLCRLRQYYNHAKPTHHAHGYGLQSVQRDGSFLHINVPIIGGKSYLSALA